MAKERQSNFELLRILAMIGVMVLHAGLYGPVADAYPMESRGGGIYLAHAFAVLSVNVFVIISGYFSIKLRIASVLNFLWTIVYWRFVTIILLRVFYGVLPDSLVGYLPFAPLSIERIGFAFQGWFIGAYLGLMVLSPALNLYSNTMTTQKIGFYCLAFFAAEVAFDWLLPSLTIFDKGYTPFAFVGLYFLGRYMARPDSVDFRLRVSLPCFFSTCLLGGSTMALSSLYGNSIPILRNKLMFCSLGYTTPLTLISSFFIIMIFKHLHFYSKFVNWLAASAFAVYLFHGGMPFFKEKALDYFSRYEGIKYFCSITLLLLGTYFIAVIIDQFRFTIWKGLCLICVKANRRTA